MTPSDLCQLLAAVVANYGGRIVVNEQQLFMASQMKIDVWHDKMRRETVLTTVQDGAVQEYAPPPEPDIMDVPLYIPEKPKRCNHVWKETRNGNIANYFSGANAYHVCELCGHRERC